MFDISVFVKMWALKRWCVTKVAHCIFQSMRCRNYVEQTTRIVLIPILFSGLKFHSNLLTLPSNAIIIGKQCGPRSDLDLHRLSKLKRLLRHFSRHQKKDEFYCDWRLYG